MHESGYSLRACTDGKLEFRDPWGGPIPYVSRPPPGDADGLIVRNRTLEIDAGTWECGDGDRMDLDLTVAALTRLTGRC